METLTDIMRPVDKFIRGHGFQFPDPRFDGAQVLLARYERELDSRAIRTLGYALFDLMVNTLARMAKERDNCIIHYALARTDYTAEMVNQFGTHELQELATMQMREACPTEWELLPQVHCIFGGNASLSVEGIYMRVYEEQN